MRCTMNFLSLLVATLKTHNFFSIAKSMFVIFQRHTDGRAQL